MSIKNQLVLICFIFFINSLTVIIAQNNPVDKNHPIFDRAEHLLKNTDTVPEYKLKNNKLKLSGTIYQKDGVTPARNVILYIEQPDENGNFDIRKTEDTRYVYHRAWVKTDIDGHYTLYTFIPGSDRRYNRLQEIYPIVKVPSSDAYEIETFLFDSDPLLTKHCRKRINKKGDVTRIVTPKKTDTGLLVAQRDIVLTVDVGNEITEEEIAK